MQMAKDGRSSSPPSPSPPPPRSSSPPPPRTGRRSSSLPRSRRSRSRSRDSEGASNPGNNLYVTGLSTRVTESDLKKYFSREGKVVDCHLVTDPHSRESRGFGFVTMETNEDGERCIKHLNRSVLEGRLITVQQAKRSRGRTPTPGTYQGPKDTRGSYAGNSGSRRRSRSYSPQRRYDRDRDFDRKDQRGGSGRRSNDHSSSRRHSDR
ncbi:hypothetical protein ABFS82_05G104800 [Erythranthe guttata]